MNNSFISGKKFLVGSLYFIFLLHILASIFGWYDSIKYFDSFHHFLGGAWVFLVGAYYWFKFGMEINNKLNKKIIFLIFGVSLTCLFGIFWEFFEFGLDQYSLIKYGVLGGNQAGLQDTMSDLLFDILGAIMAGFAYLPLLKQNRK
ncbi:MAG: hypothetical protein EXS49_02665 [Candidatus Pacebacteria bacterium]|nr:hypothetical protein [Candidatus Paceibacterota bacterium]